MKFSTTVPKPPKGGCNVLWSDDDPEATSHAKSYLIGSHVNAGPYTGEAIRDHVFLEQLSSSHEKVLWKKLKIRRHAQ